MRWSGAGRSWPSSRPMRRVPPAALAKHTQSAARADQSAVGPATLRRDFLSMRWSSRLMRASRAGHCAGAPAGSWGTSRRLGQEVAASLLENNNGTRRCRCESKVPSAPVRQAPTATFSIATDSGACSGLARSPPAATVQGPPRRIGGVPLLSNRAAIREKGKAEASGGCHRFASPDLTFRRRACSSGSV